MKYAGRPRLPEGVSRANLLPAFDTELSAGRPRFPEGVSRSCSAPPNSEDHTRRNPRGLPPGAKARRYAIIDPIQQAAMHTTIVPTSTHVVLNFLPMIQYMKPKTMSWGRHGMIMSK